MPSPCKQLSSRKDHTTLLCMYMCMLNLPPDSQCVFNHLPTMLNLPPDSQCVFNHLPTMLNLPPDSQCVFNHLPTMLNLPPDSQSVFNHFKLPTASYYTSAQWLLTATNNSSHIYNQLHIKQPIYRISYNSANTRSRSPLTSTVVGIVQYLPHHTHTY